MQALQRITTEYDEHEDRLRLSGELPDGSSVVLWLTQRLLNRLVPHLTAWLTQHGTPLSADKAMPWLDGHDLQGFAQQAAQSQLVVQAPVCVLPSTASWRVDTVKVTQHSAGVALVFKGEASEQQVELPMAPMPLRQWLGIVYAQTQRGQWPMAAWPTWMHESQACGAPPAAALH